MVKKKKPGEKKSLVIKVQFLGRRGVRVMKRWFTNNKALAFGVVQQTKPNEKKERKKKIP